MHPSPVISLSCNTYQCVADSASLAIEIAILSYLIIIIEAVATRIWYKSYT